MAYVDDHILDPSLSEIDTDCNSIHLCSAEPSTYTEATSTYTLGNRATPTISTPADGSPNGRAVTVSAITDGTVTSAGTATHYALVDTTGTRLLVAHSLASSVALATGSPWQSTAFTIRLPDV